MNFNRVKLLLVSSWIFNLNGMDSGQIKPLPTHTLANENWYIVQCACFTPNGQQLAVSGMLDLDVEKGTHKNIVRLWNTNGYKTYADLDNFDASLGGLAINSEGTKIACGSLKSINVWDIYTQLHLMDLRGHTDVVHTLDWDKEGGLLLSSGQDGTARIWDTRTRKCVRVLDCQTSTLYQAFWNPKNSNQIATSQLENCVKLWDARNGKYEQTQEVDTPINTIAYSPSGEKLALAINGKMALCETVLGKITGHSPYWQGAPADQAAHVLMYLPDNEHTVLAGMYSEDGQLGICDLNDEKRTVHFPAIPGLASLTCPRSGAVVAVAEGVISEEVKMYTLAGLSKGIVPAKSSAGWLWRWLGH